MGYTNETITNSNLVYCIYVSFGVLGYGLYVLIFLVVKNKNNKKFYGEKFVPFKQQMPAKRLNGKVVLICIAIAILALFMLNGFVNMTTAGLQGLGYNKSNDLPFAVNNAYNYILYLIFFCALPAFLEEFLFRGIILGGLLNSSKTKEQIILSIIFGALVFALCHQSAQQFVYPLIMGSVFGLIFYYTGNIWYSIITHFVSNATVVTINFIQELTNQTIFGIDLSVGMCLVYCALALAFIALVIPLFKIIKKECKGQSCYNYLEEEDVRTNLIYEKSQDTKEELKYLSSDGIVRYRATRKENDRLAFVMGIIVLVMLFVILIVDLVSHL